jgi:hypothetical protein
MKNIFLTIITICTLITATCSIYLVIQYNYLENQVIEARTDITTYVSDVIENELVTQEELKDKADSLKVRASEYIKKKLNKD